MEPWQDCELWANGARGILWCFTELPRQGQRICRRTVQDRSLTWYSKTGRSPKNGLPLQIRVDNLAIRGTDYRMLEFTLEHETTVALCKIWTDGNRAAQSSPHQSMNEETPAPNNQVGDNHETEPTDQMQVDQQPQEQLGDVEGSYFFVSRDITHSTTQDVYSTYQGAISVLYDTMHLFRGIVSHGRNEAHDMIVSNAQTLASDVMNLLDRFNSLRINIEPGNTSQPASTTTTNQITDSVTEQAMQAAELVIEDENVLKQEPALQMDDFLVDDFIDVDELLSILEWGDAKVSDDLNI